jgi:hypothetical protein
VIKICSSCSSKKPLTAFGRRSGYSKDGRQGVCKECRNAKRRQAHTPEKGRKENLWYRFGLSLDEYNQMFKSQNGCCAICEDPQEGLSKNLAVDHCADTKVIRGLLCDNCNRAIGQLKHSVKNLMKAISYLQKERDGAKIIPLKAYRG